MNGTKEYKKRSLASTDSPFTLFKKIKTLGKGSYGEVLRVKNKNTGEIFALKKIIQKSPQGIPQSTLREISTLQKLNHPNIIKLLQIFYNLE